MLKVGSGAVGLGPHAVSPRAEPADCPGWGGADALGVRPTGAQIPALLEPGGGWGVFSLGNVALLLQFNSSSATRGGRGQIILAGVRFKLNPVDDEVAGLPSTMVISFAHIRLPLRNVCMSEEKFTRKTKHARFPGESRESP